jgi:hypothetical protein
VGHLGGEAGPVVVPIEPVVLGDEEQEQGGELLPARQLEQPPPEVEVGVELVAHALAQALDGPVVPPRLVPVAGQEVGDLLRAQQVQLPEVPGQRRGGQRQRRPPAVDVGQLGGTRPPVASGPDDGLQVGSPGPQLVQVGVPVHGRSLPSLESPRGLCSGRDHMHGRHLPKLRSSTGRKVARRGPRPPGSAGRSRPPHRPASAAAGLIRRRSPWRRSSPTAGVTGWAGPPSSGRPRSGGRPGHAYSSGSPCRGPWAG